MRGKAWIGFAALLPRILSAQPDVSSREPVGSLTTSCSVQMWRMEAGDHRVVNQVSFPVLLTAPVGRNIQLTVRHTPAMSQWFGGYKINGTSDTWIQGSYLHPNKTLLLNVKARIAGTVLNNISSDMLAGYTYYYHYYYEDGHRKKGEKGKRKNKK